MKGSLIVIVFFCVGCIMGVFNKFQFDTHTVSMYTLIPQHYYKIFFLST